MPSAANGEVDRHGSTYGVDSSPIRRVVEILQAKIACLEKQRSKLTSGREAKSGKDSSGEQKGGQKVEELSQMLEFVWDLCKQVMGIAVLSENEAKKQARKEIGHRKTQDVQLVHKVLLVLDCLEQLSDQSARADFLSGSCGASQLTENDLRVLDDIYPEVTPKHCPEEGEPSFETQTMTAAKHLMAIIDGNPQEVIGSTYAHIKNVVDTVHECKYFDHPRELRVEEPEEEVNEVEEITGDNEFVAPPPPPAQVPAPPPPAPQAVPAPAFPILPPTPPTVTLQQVEHAYFAHQYGHQQKPPIAEVFGAQSFIFLQESEIDTPETTQQPSPRPVSPTPIPSQTFTNQNFAIPAQHFNPDLAPNPHINLNNIPQSNTHFQPGISDVPAAHMPGFPTAANPPPPIPMPPSHITLPHVTLAQGQVNISPSNLPQPRLPSPSFQNVTYKHNVSHSLDRTTAQLVASSESSQEEIQPSSPEHRDADYNEWNEEPQESHQTEPLEITEWNPPQENRNEQENESSNNTDGQSGSNKFRPRGRGRGSSSGSFRGRGGYQNGRSGSGSYYRNNEGYQSSGNNGNGSNYNDSYRDGNRYDNSQGGFQQGGYKGRSTGGGRGGPRQGNGVGRGAPRGGAPRGGNRPQYPRKAGNNQYDSRTGTDNKQYAQ